MNWIRTIKNKPKKGIPVIGLGLNSNNKIRRIRVKWIPKYYMECDGDNYIGDDRDYDEKTDQFYWLEGWYEWNEFEDIHWRVDFEILYWTHLPEPPIELLNILNCCGWCGNKLCDSQIFNNTCFNCGKSPYSNNKTIDSNE